MADITELWSRLEAWGNEHAPKMLEDLNPGANPAAIAMLEAALGRELPATFRQSLTIHNGESDGWPNKAFADMGAYHSSEGIVQQRDMRLQVAKQVGGEFSDEERAQQIKDSIITVDGPVRPDVFNPDWIPIMDCNGDVFWALDFAPADAGVPGQIIRVDLESCEWRVVAPSFESFFSAYIASLEAGEFPIVEGLPSKEEW